MAGEDQRTEAATTRASHKNQEVSGGGPRSPRRLAVIMFMDMVGYSALVAADEEGTLARWRSLRVDVLESIVASHHGRIIRVIGDELMLEFSNAEDGMSCALTMHAAIDLINADLPPGARMSFRIGLHLGEVLEEAGEITGHHVNIAARLRAEAPPGGIVVSSAVRERVGRRLSAVFSDLGARRLKNLPEPVPAFLCRASAEAPVIPVPIVRRPSIAVLPFENLTGDPGQDYIAAGFVEDVIGELARLQSLLVVSRHSTLALPEHAGDPSTIGAMLGVRYVLRGSIRRNGDRLLIFAELADANTGSILSATRHVGQVAEIFDLQDRLAIETVMSVVPHIENAEISRVLRQRPESLDAYDLTLRALAKLALLDRSSMREASSLLRRAIALDPRYADPHSWLAKWHIVRIAQGWSRRPDRDHAIAASHATAAVKRSPNDSLALAIEAHAHSFLNREYDTATDLFSRALSATPNHPLAWSLSSATRTYLGDSQAAVDQASYALRLSPFDIYGFFLYSALSFAHCVARNNEAAVHAAREALKRSPNHAASLRALIFGLVRLGNLDEAKTNAARLMAIQPDFRVSRYRERAPFRDPALREEMGDLLIRAGIPN